MSFCIVIEDGNKQLVASYYSSFFAYEPYMIVDEVIECIKNYNRLIPRIKNLNEIALYMTNTRENMESLGYSYDMCSPLIDDVTKYIIKKHYSGVYFPNNRNDYRMITVSEDKMQSFVDNADKVIIIDISLKFVSLNMYKYTSNESEFVKEMKLEKNFDFDKLEAFPFGNIYNLTICDLEDIRDFFKKIGSFGFKDLDKKVYYIPGKVEYFIPKISTSRIVGSV